MLNEINSHINETKNHIIMHGMVRIGYSLNLYYDIKENSILILQTYLCGISEIR